MVAGNSTKVASPFYCNRQYWLTKNTQLYWTLQNTLTYPTASAYTERLFKEVNSPKKIKDHLEGQLAVITNIAKDGSSYFVTEELALMAGMDICLVGKNLKKLKQIELVLLDARRKRLAQLAETQAVVGKREEEGDKKTTKVDASSIRLPKIYKIHMDSASLASVLQASKDIEALIEEHYHGKLPILIQNPSGVTVAYETTENGVEINVARNFVAPHVLTEKLLPSMQKAATESYKPRLILVSSVGHSQGTDFDPDRFLSMPDEGGAPEGTFQEQQGEENTANIDASDNNNTTKGYVENELDGPVIMYYRSKMALMANAMALAQENPWLAPISVYPGSVVTTSHSKTRNLGIAEMIYQTGFSMFQLDPTQAARASLRAALDPDFNPGGALSEGSYYLHCDGNPWTMAAPNIENVYYSLEEYAAKVRECTQQLCQTLLESAAESAANSANEKEKDSDDGDDKEGDNKNATKEDPEQPSKEDLA